MDKLPSSFRAFESPDNFRLAAARSRGSGRAAIAGAEAQAADRRQYIEAGTRQFWRVNVALVAAAFCTFALIYCVQPLMPLLASVFEVSPARRSVSLSVTTGLPAVGMLFSGAASEMLRRKALMATSLLLSASLTVATAFAPDWHLRAPPLAMTSESRFQGFEGPLQIARLDRPASHARPAGGGWAYVEAVSSPIRLASLGRLRTRREAPGALNRNPERSEALA
jgi:hypothetical protein